MFKFLEEFKDTEPSLQVGSNYLDQRHYWDQLIEH